MKTPTMLSFLCCVLMFVPSVLSQSVPSEKPNIIVFLCDDLGYGDLSSYGHPVIKTPHLDRMAREGLRLTSCYSAAPVCSPSRVGLLTGRSPNRAGVYDWIPHASREQANLRDRVHMQRNEITIPMLLKESGYQTCLVGKWHCNSHFNNAKQPQPNHAGFDHWFATQNNASPRHENPKNFVRNGDPVGPLTGFSAGLIVEEGIQWLGQRDTQRPFFLHVCFHEPHEPVSSPPDLVDTYRSKAVNEDQAQYFANVENVDRAVGRLMTYLKQKQWHENTLAVFTSDNGPETLNRYKSAYRSYGSPGDLKGMKLWTTEAGFRVPGIIHWPGVVPAGWTSNEVVSSLDLLPTFCALANTALPTRPLDGADLSGFLKGQVLVRNKPLLWCYYNAINEQRVAMRAGHWKILATLQHHGETLPKLSNVYPGNRQMIQNAQLVDFELYLVGQDLAESKDVSENFPLKFAEMRRELQHRYAELVQDSHVWTR